MSVKGLEVAQKTVFSLLIQSGSPISVYLPTFKFYRVLTSPLHTLASGSSLHPCYLDINFPGPTCLLLLELLLLGLSIRSQARPALHSALFFMTAISAPLESCVCISLPLTRTRAS